MKNDLSVQLKIFLLVVMLAVFFQLAALSVEAVGLEEIWRQQLYGPQSFLVSKSNPAFRVKYNSSTLFEVQHGGLVNVSNNLLVSGMITSNYSTNISNDKIDTHSVCFGSDACLVNGTSTWLYIRNSADSSNANLRLYNLYATNLIELAPNSKLIFGYTDTDKFLRYNSVLDKMELLTDNVNFVYQNGSVEVDKGNLSVNAGYRVCFDGTSCTKYITANSSSLILRVT